MLDMLCLTGEVGWARLSPATATRRSWSARRRSRCSSASTASSGSLEARRRRAPSTRRRNRRIQRRGRARARSAARRAARSFFAELAACCGLDEGRSARRWAISSPRAWSRRMASAACGRSCARRRRGRPCRGRWREQSPADGRCSTSAGNEAALARSGSRSAGTALLLAATASSSGGCWHAKRTPPPGASWPASTAGSKRAAKSAAAGSCPACRANSSRWPTRSSGCARSAARRRDGRCIVISAADPLNLAGIVTAGERVRAVAATAWSTATACRWPRWKAIMCDH